MKTFSIFVNDQLVFEYDKDTPIDGDKLEFLDKMDSDMERGIKIHGELLSSPDNHQRARFVALNLIKALQQENHASIASCSAYLANRLPRLVKLHAYDQEGVIAIDFTEDQ